MGFPDVKAADHHILVGGRPAFTYFKSGEVHVGYDAPATEATTAATTEATTEAATVETATAEGATAEAGTAETATAEVGTAEGAPPEGARAVLFPGWERLTGVVAVSTVLAESAIDRVVILGGADAVPEMLIDTGDFVRPIWRGGVLTLVTQFARGGVLVPFESASQQPCCQDH